ncbi:hypothetical protein ACFQGW_14500 [Xanthomonas theicola]|uniref:hypothetical protein n=1 Tax=Xanthomonas theicola TaxID=56464 RepID=UPI003621480C
MCGIVALRSFAGDTDWQARAGRALDALARRGPDARGLLCLEQPLPTALGHRRLAILDLSSAADQPMRCADSGNAVVFNGEIYNFLELRRELQALGHRFRTDSDTEVILHGWRAWGEALFPRCNGMWAVVVLEQATGDLIYCRDRLGVKPLYLHHDGRQLLLASEIGAIAAALGGYPPPTLARSSISWSPACPITAARPSTRASARCRPAGSTASRRVDTRAAAAITNGRCPARRSRWTPTPRARCWRTPRACACARMCRAWRCCPAAWTVRS